MRNLYLLIVCATLIMTAAAAYAKSGRTLYTPDKIATMRENIEKYDWAKAIRDSAVAAAEDIVNKPHEELASWVPDPRIPRSIYVHETGCPNCGLQMRKHGNYSWIIDPDKPYKVKCPNCGKVYPSNDYQAFIDSGFEDRSLLTGDHPDDGWGWQSPEYPDQKYWFVAWYNHWMTRRRLLPAIDKLYRAYLFTDDPKYASKCGVLLWQIAEYYPDYDYVNQSRIGTEIKRNYHGKLFYHTWETSTVHSCARAYDAIYPALAEGCAELEAYTGKSSEDIRHLIEEQLLRDMARHIVEETRHIAGNYGSHQSGLLEIAATLKDTPGEPSSEAMIDWLLNNEEYDVYTMMPLYDALYNLVYCDGTPFESPGYNLGWVRNLTQIAELLLVNGVDVFDNPRFRKLYDWPIDMVIAGEFTPSLGDSGNISNRGRMWRENIYDTAYRTYQDPRYAAVLSEMSSTPGRDIFKEPITEQVSADAASLNTPLGFSDRHLPGYGLAIFQTGDTSDTIAASLFYGKFLGHSHRDKMHLDIFAENCSMMPDFGYPETANSTDPRRAGFFAHTISHNTVMVDKSSQANGRGRCLAYDPGPVCKYVETENNAVYEQCETYRRSVAMVTAAQSPYILDVFRIRGGSQHDWLVHGTNAEVTSNLDFSPPREEGTLAGPGVEYGYFYDDPKLADAPYGSVNYFTYRGSSFQFLFNVQNTTLQPDGWVQWDVITGGPQAAGLVRANDGAFLRAHLVGENENVFLCDGIPQKNRQGTPEAVKFCVRRRAGEDLDSTFVTLFEPGAGEPSVRSVHRVETPDPDLVALKITLESGATHYYFNAAEPVAECEIEDGIRFAGRVGLLCLDAAGAVDRAYLHDATLLARGDWRLEGPSTLNTTVSDCDYTANTVTLADPVTTDRIVDGHTAVILRGAYGATFTINDVMGDRTLAFGDQLPIKGRAYVKELKPDEGKIVTPTSLPFVVPGMSVVNEKMEPVGRVADASGGALTLDEPFQNSDFTDADGDGTVRAYVMDYGPGDTVNMPSSVRYERK
ncbi:MAG: heparinase II/III family protein [Armatimonadota bacterium]